MTERERFEAWARPRWTHPEDLDRRIKAIDKYNSYEVQAAWEAWKERADQSAPSAQSGAELNEDQWWFMELLAAAEQPGASLDLRRAVFGVVRRMISDMEKVRSALHHISLCSQNSASSKGECGRIARAALTPSAENSSTSPGGRAAGPTASDLP